MNRTRLTAATAVLALSLAGAIAPASAGTADASDTGTEAATYRVSLKASTKLAVRKQDTVSLTGTVRPKAPGTKVAVQLQYEGRKAWRTIGSAKVKSDGSYRFTDKPVSRLDRSYRVVKAGDSAATRGVSRERAVEVLGWDWLDGRTPSAVQNVANAFPMPINGIDYGHTLYATKAFTTGFAEYTLGRQCLLLETTVGLSDRTASGGQGSVKISRDGVAAYQRDFNLGQSESLSIVVEDTFRVRLDFAQLNGTPATEPSAGAARVLCD